MLYVLGNILSMHTNFLLVWLNGETSYSNKAFIINDLGNMTMLRTPSQLDSLRGDAPNNKNTHLYSSQMGVSTLRRMQNETNDLCIEEVSIISRTNLSCVSVTSLLRSNSAALFSSGMGGCCSTMATNFKF